MKKKTIVAQIGVGYWGPNLLRNLIANEDCQVKWVSDLSEERRRFVKRLYPRVKLTDDVERIFDDPDVDAVIIATPVASHFDMATQALQKSKHILVEKPMAKTVEEIAAIGELAKSKDLVAMAGHTFVYNSAVRYLKKLIDTGQLGEVRYIYSQRVNLGRIRTDVDALWNFAPHDISIIHYLLGDPKPVSVSKRGMDYVQPGVFDVVFLNIEYPNKIMANIHVSWLDPDKVRRLIVVGSEKMVVYDDVAVNKIAVYDKGIDKKAILGEEMDYDEPGEFVFSHRSGDLIYPKIEYLEPLKTEIEHFLSCIQNGTECITGVEHAKKVVEVLVS